MTIAALAEKYGRKADTLWRKAKRAFPGRAWSLYSVITEDEERILLGNYPAPSAVSAPVRKAKGNGNMQAPAKGRQWLLQDVRKMRRVAFNAVCLSIVAGHAGLIWYDCVELWQTAGQIGGMMAFLFVLGCLLVSTDKSRNRTSYIALWIMFGVDVAAWWVHWPVFTRQMTNYDLKNETGVLCAVICALSFAALLIYRDEKLD